LKSPGAKFNIQQNLLSANKVQNIQTTVFSSAKKIRAFIDKNSKKDESQIFNKMKSSFLFSADIFTRKTNRYVDGYVAIFVPKTVRKPFIATYIQQNCYP